MSECFAQLELFMMLIDGWIPVHVGRWGSISSWDGGLVKYEWLAQKWLHNDKKGTL